ncbi:hypothetical protein DSECCO2_656620 [anaerobic digester metagenome]
MTKIDDLLLAYKKQIALPWTEMLSPQEKVWFCIYDPSQERRLRKQMEAFAIVTQETGHDWTLIDLTSLFEQFLSSNEHQEKYYQNPRLVKFEEKNFLKYLTEHVKMEAVQSTSSSVVAITGIGSLYGIMRVSKVVEGIVKTVPIPGRLLVFFPGERDGKNYRLLKARDGWNYLATPIEAEESD